MSSTGRPRKAVDARQIAALRERGFNWTQVARSLGVHRNTLVRRREEDPLFKELTDIEMGYLTPEDEAVGILLTATKPETNPRRRFCKGCWKVIRRRGFCDRCQRLERVIRDAESECADIFPRAVGEAKQRKQRAIATLPEETRRLLRKIQQLSERGLSVDIVTRLREAADQLEAMQ